MDFSQYLKDNFDEVLTENSKNIYEQNKEQSNIKNTLNICKSELSNIKINNYKEDEKNEENEEFYTREEIYGEYDSDFDNIDEDVYKKLPVEFDEKYFVEMENEQNEDDYKDIEYDEEFEKLVELERQKEKEKESKDKSLIEIEDDSDEEDRIFNKEMQNIIDKINESGKEDDNKVLNNVLDDPERKVIRVKKHCKKIEDRNKTVKFNEEELEKINEINEISDNESDIYDDNDKNLKYQNQFESVVNNKTENDENDKNEDEKDEDDEGVYIINTLNLFMEYYNKKNNKVDNMMSGIKNNEDDVNKQMSEFTYAVNEYEYIKKKIFDNKRDSFCFKNKYLVEEYIDDEDFENFYVLLIENKNEEEIERIYSPSLLDCLNYLYVKEIKNTWKIINIK